MSAGGSGTAITAAATDPEGDAITWSLEEVSSGPSGDSKIVVGAQGDSNFAGAVYLYDLDGSNEIKIVPPNTIEQDRVGFDVAVANQKIYISAVLEDNESLNPEGQHGSVWIYDLDGSNGQILRADTDEHMLNFGRSVSAAGGKLAVYADGTDNSGKLFIYDADGSNEIQVTELQSGNGYAYDMIMDDSKIVVGNSNTLPVQVFNHDGTEAFKLTPSGSPNGYGSRVAMGSDKIAVAYENGAYVFNSDGTNEQIISGLSNLPELAIGSGKLVMVNTVVDTVYVYDIESLTLEASFSSSFTNYQFGFRVSVADNKIYVTNLNPTGVGTLEVYDLDGSNGYIINSNVSGDYYGYSVDVSDGAAQSALNGVTVTQSDNVFTVTPGSEATSFSMRFTATDANGNATTTTSAFTVEDAPEPQMGDLFIGSDGNSTGDFNHASEVDAWTKTSNTNWLAHRSGEGGHMEMGWGTNNQVGGYIELDVVPNTEYTISFSGTATSGAPVGHANYRDAYVNVRVVDSEPVGTNAAALILQTTPSTTGGSYPSGASGDNGYQSQGSKSGYQTLTGTITPHGSKLTIQLLNVDKVVQYFDDFSVTGLIPV